MAVVSCLETFANEADVMAPTPHKVMSFVYFMSGALISLSILQMPSDVPIDGKRAWRMAGYCWIRKHMCIYEVDPIVTA